MRNALSYIRLARNLLCRHLIFYYPPIELRPERLALWLNFLKSTMSIPGDIVEVGCYLGGTAVISSQMTKRLGSNKRYFAIDTFSGFMEPDFAADIALGNVPTNKWIASDGCKSLAEWIAGYHRADRIKFIQGNIATIDVDHTIGLISAILIDCDLAVPTYAALSKLYPKLAPGGIILVDDVDPKYKWQSRHGVERFSAETNIAFTMMDGMAVHISKATTGVTTLDMEKRSQK